MHDHHCKWIKNCVGKGNYSYFITFLIFLALNVIFEQAIIIYLMIPMNYSIDILNNPVFLEASLCLIINFLIFGFIIPIIIKQIQSCKKNKIVHKKFSSSYIIASFKEPHYNPDSTSDTASMFLIENSDSNSEAKSSLSSQFITNS